MKNTKVLEDKTIKYVVQKNVFSTASQLCSENIYANDFNLHSISQIIEAIILYDELIIYDYIPHFDQREHYLQNLLKTPLGVELINLGLLTVKNPYEYFVTEKEEVELFANLHNFNNIPKIHFCENVDGSDGYVNISAMQPPSFLNFDNNIFLNEPDLNAFNEGFSKAYSKKMLPIARKAEGFNEFIVPWIRNRFWQVEMGNFVRESENASGLSIPADCGPLWVREKEMAFSKLHNKYNDFSKIMYENKFINEHQVDFSPLTTIAFDTSLNRDRLIETILQMRNDYVELREYGKKFQTLLESAETYLEIEETISEWDKTWSTILSKITKTEKPLLRKLFGWDNFKSVSSKRILANSLHEIGKEITSIPIQKRLSIITFMECEFISSRRIELNINRLFNGLCKEPLIKKIE